jgi:hypothetical protein
MNWQGGIDSSENLKEKRTYDQTAGDKWPVKYVLLFISKTDLNATSLSNRCSKSALNKHEDESVYNILRKAVWLVHRSC